MPVTRRDVNLASGPRLWQSMKELVPVVPRALRAPRAASKRAAVSALACSLVGRFLFSFRYQHWSPNMEGGVSVWNVIMLRLAAV